MSRVGPFFSQFFKTMSPYRSLGAFSSFAILSAVLVVAISTPARAYVLEGKSWPSGTTVLMQLNLGSAGRTLQDGNTSWDDAVLPVAAMWNQTLQRVSVNTIVNPAVPVVAGDRINCVVFSNSVYGQAFGSGTLAVTYYSYSGGSMVESDTPWPRATWTPSAIPSASCRRP